MNHLATKEYSELVSNDKPHHTKEKIVKAFVGYKLIDEYFFFSFQTKPKNSNQILVLKLCHKNSLILELLRALP